MRGKKQSGASCKGCSPQMSPLFSLWHDDGFVATGGINRSKNKAHIHHGELYRAKNIQPSYLGLSNKNLGVAKISKNSVAGIPRGLTEFKPYNKPKEHIIVKNGSVYRVAFGSGIEYLIASNVFNPSKKVVFAEMTGGSPKVKKLYMTDGVSRPCSWDGTNFTQLNLFQTPLLGIDFPNPMGMIRWRSRLVWYFPAGDYQDYVLFSDDDNAETYTNSLATDAAYYEIVAPGESDTGVIALASLKKDNTERQLETIIAIKSNQRAYLSTGKTLPDAGNNQGTIDIVATFSLLASDIGAINQNSIVNFANDVLLLDKNGIGAFESSTQSGGIDVMTYEFGLRVNGLIREASKNQAFENCFAVHNPYRQEIMWFMPKNEFTSPVENSDFFYPETPNNLCIVYNYGVQEINNQPISFWSTREGYGWGWAAGSSSEGRTFLASYYGAIYELYIGAEYERNPSRPDTLVPIESLIETGDLSFSSDIRKTKQLSYVNWEWYVKEEVVFDNAFAYDESRVYGNNQKNLKVRLVDIKLIPDLWNSGDWTNNMDDIWLDPDLYLDYQPANHKVYPMGLGKTVRLQVKWSSYKIVEEVNKGCENFGNPKRQKLRNIFAEQYVLADEDTINLNEGILYGCYGALKIGIEN